MLCGAAVAGIIGLSAVLMGYTSLMDLYHNGMGGIQGALLNKQLSLHVGATDTIS